MSNSLVAQVDPHSLRCILVGFSLGCAVGGLLWLLGDLQGMGKAYGSTRA